MHFFHINKNKTYFVRNYLHKNLSSRGDKCKIYIKLLSVLGAESHDGSAHLGAGYISIYIVGFHCYFIGFLFKHDAASAEPSVEQLLERLFPLVHGTQEKTGTVSTAST